MREREKAAAHLLLVCQQMPDHDGALANFSQVMAQRGRLDIAYDAAAEALRLNPKNGKAKAILEKIQSIAQGKDLRPGSFQIELEIYPSRAPRKLVQLRRLPGGRVLPHGIEVEFYENGRLKSFRDLVGGKVTGPVKTWDEQGKELTGSAAAPGGACRKLTYQRLNRWIFLKIFGVFSRYGKNSGCCRSSLFCCCLGF